MNRYLNALEKNPPDNIIAPMKYLGGKTRSLWKLLRYVPNGKRYVEVFGGSGILLLSRTPVAFEVYNDIDLRLVDFYRTLKYRPNEIKDKLKYVIHSRKRFESSRFSGPFEWFYRNAFSFAGLGTKFGRMTKGENNLTTALVWRLKTLDRVVARLKGVGIWNLDWRECFRLFDSEDTIFYCDPPYLHTTHQYVLGMSPQEHVELLDAIHNLKGKCAISGRSSSLYDSYTWADRQSWKVKEQLSAAAHKNTAEEVLWIKN